MARQGAIAGLSALFLNETQLNQAAAPGSVFVNQSAAAPTAAAPGAGVVVFTGFAPSGDSSAMVGAGAIMFTGFAPTPANVPLNGIMVSIIC